MDVAASLYFVAWVVVAAVLLLMVLGLGLRGLAGLFAMSLPMARDDPARVEWAGLAVLVLYGCVAGAGLVVCYVAGRRLLGATARAHVGRAVGTLALLVGAAAGVVGAAQGSRLTGAAFALTCGYGATRLARGLPLDPDDDAERPLPASFSTPPVLVDDQPTANVATWTPPPQRPFRGPSARQTARP